MRRNAYTLVVLAALAALLALAGPAAAENGEAPPAAEGGTSAAGTQDDNAGADDTEKTERHEPERGDAADGEAPGEEPANGKEPKGDGKETKPDDGGGGLNRWFLPIMIGGLVLLFLLMGRGGRKREKQRQQMLAAIKKGDKVTTIGGIIGTVADLNEDEVTLRLDDNTRMRVVRRAINQVGEGSQAAGADKGR